MIFQLLNLDEVEYLLNQTTLLMRENFNLGDRELNYSIKRNILRLCLSGSNCSNYSDDKYRNSVQNDYNEFLTKNGLNLNFTNTKRINILSRLYYNDNDKRNPYSFLNSEVDEALEFLKKSNSEED